MTHSLHDAPLGKPVAYPDHYDATLLFPIARAGNRAALALDAAALPFDGLPFGGVDIWNAYELSWLDPRGKPRVALAEFRVPASSPNIIESKSFKLYLNGYAGTRLASADELTQRLAADLSTAAGAAVAVTLTAATDFHRQRLQELAGESIDDLDLAIDHYGPPQADTLRADDHDLVHETLLSHLLKSNCPVTGQPDWASVQVDYRGPRIDRERLLRYLIGFRSHSDFHEACVERIFVDLLRHCRPQALAVYARYTRRGGLDINPFRATPGFAAPANPRGARQ